MKALLTILAFCLSLFGTASAEEPKMKPADTTVKVETKLGVGRFNTILDSYRQQGIDVGKLNHPAPPAEVEITYVTYTDSGKDDKVTLEQIKADLKASGYRPATIEELASIDAGNSGLADGQKVIAFGTFVKISPTETLMFGAGIKGQQFAMQILKVNPAAPWTKKGLLIPAVKLKTTGGRTTI